MLDLKLVNARVLTLDREHPRATQLGVWRGRVFGLDERVAELPARRVWDLDGRVVIPGFVDAHVHLAWAGLKSGTPSVAPSDSVPAILDGVREAADRVGPDDWVDVAGYDQRPLGRHLTAGELDAAAPGRRVILTHDSGHSCVVSTPVLRMLPEDTVHQDGVLVEGGMAAVRQLRMPYSEAELGRALRRSTGVCVSEGVTACAEAGIGGGLVTHSPVELAAYQSLREAGQLPLRVQLMVAAAALHPVGAHPQDGPGEGLDLGLRTGFGDDRLRLGALKIFTDGGMMPRTAALTEPYEGLEHAGELYADPEELTDTIVRGHLAGWQLAIHAIGDRAVDLALDAVAEAQRRHPRPGARHRVEHAGLVRPDQLPRFAELGLGAVVQPGFLWYLGDDYAPLMGPRRAPWLYRGQSFLDHGVPLAGSSDRPVTVGAPLRAVEVMVRRASSSGLPIGPDEAMSVEDALRAYTLGSAYACHWEDEVGSLTPGKWADWVVLSEDPCRVDPERIGQIEVLGTFVAGESVYGLSAPG
ncbi:amidohydrolase [Streptomyces sp. NPDC005438]|uniref:amidohydrolase n=1 Tax=Streptomyces sp. NPDC005438 TaxID=3156880 RepID=UPI0033B2A5E6